MGDLYFASVDSVFLFVNAEVFLSQGLSGKRKITNESSFVHYCGAFVSLWTRSWWEQKFSVAQ